MAEVLQHQIYITLRNRSALHTITYIIANSKNEIYVHAVTSLKNWNRTYNCTLTLVAQKLNTQALID